MSNLDDNKDGFYSPNEFTDLEEIPLEPATTNENKTPTKKKKNPIVVEIISDLKIVIIAALIAIVCNRFVIVNAKVPTGSMTNTIMVGDRLIGFRLSYLFSDPQRGDVVIFKYPDDESQNYVKRIIGLPGDIVRIENGVVYVNGDELNESYIKEPMKVNSEIEEYVVPTDCYFMMGDNRNNSLDSRYWNNTFVKRDKIIAKAIFKYYKGFGMIE